MQRAIVRHCAATPTEPAAGVSSTAPSARMRKATPSASSSSKLARMQTTSFSSSSRPAAAPTMHSKILRSEASKTATSGFKPDWNDGYLADKLSGGDIEEGSANIQRAFTTALNGLKGRKSDTEVHALLQRLGDIVSTNPNHLSIGLLARAVGTVGRKYTEERKDRNYKVAITTISSELIKQMQNVLFERLVSFNKRTSTRSITVCDSSNTGSGDASQTPSFTSCVSPKNNISPTPKDLANILWGLAKTNFRLQNKESVFYHNLFKQVAKGNSLANGDSSIQSMDVAHALWAFSKLKGVEKSCTNGSFDSEAESIFFQFPELWHKSGVGLIRRIGFANFSGCEVVMVLSAYNAYLQHVNLRNENSQGTHGLQHLHVFFADQMNMYSVTHKDLSQIAAVFASATPEVCVKIFPKLITRFKQIEKGRDAESSLFTLRDLTSLIYTMGKANVLRDHIEFARQLLPRIRTECIRHKESRGISNTLWACVQDQDTHSLAKEFLLEAQFPIDLLDESQHYANVLHSMAFCQIRCDRMVEVILSKLVAECQLNEQRQHIEPVERRRPPVKPEEISATLWALANLGFTGSNSVFSADSSIQDVVSKRKNAGSSTQKVGSTGSSIMESIDYLKNYFIRNHACFNVRPTSNVLWSLALMGHLWVCQQIPAFQGGVGGVADMYQAQLYVVWLAEKLYANQKEKVVSPTFSDALSSSSNSPGFTSSLRSCTSMGDSMEGDWLLLRNAYRKRAKDVDTSKRAQNLTEGIRGMTNLEVVAEYDISGSGILVDAAFPQRKLAIEIDGPTHTLWQVLEGTSNGDKDSSTKSKMSSATNDDKSGSDAGSTSSLSADIDDKILFRDIDGKNTDLVMKRIGGYDILPRKNGLTGFKSRIASKLGWRLINIPGDQGPDARAMLQRLLRREGIIT